MMPGEPVSERNDHKQQVTACKPQELLWIVEVKDEEKAK